MNEITNKQFKEISSPRLKPGLTYFQDPKSRIRLHSLILQSLEEMPVLMRRAFVHRHYHGFSLTRLSARMGLAEHDLVLILRSADLRLQRLLRKMIQEGGHNAKTA
jgi:DNA-directed RNA polymerase specialized sigma24 family protein